MGHTLSWVDGTPSAMFRVGGMVHHESCLGGWECQPSVVVE